MRRSRLTRVLGILAAAWLSLTLGEPGIIHACAVHGGLDATASAGAHNHGAPANAHAGHGAAAAPETSAPGHEHGACTCLGECSGVTAAVAGPTSATVAVATVLVDRPAPVPTEQATRHQSPDHTLPFANGPPPVSRSA